MNGEPMETPGDPSVLLDRASAGDREAFMALVRDNQQKVFGLAYALLRNRDDALDVVQETFLRLHQKMHLFRKDGQFQGWLLQIARNACIDYYRKNVRNRREMESPDVDAERLPAGGTGPSDEERSDLREAFARCVDRLAERQRMVFVLRHYDELPFHEISETMSISVGTAKSLHFKAVRNMKRMLTPFLGVSP